MNSFNEESLRSPNQLICEFEVAREIKAANVHLMTFFFYLHFPNTGKYFVYRNKTALKTQEYNREKGIACELVAAPLSEELSAILPERHYSWWEWDPKDPQKKVSKAAFNHRTLGKVEAHDDKESTARAKLLLKLVSLDQHYSQRITNKFKEVR